LVKHSFRFTQVHSEWSNYKSSSAYQVIGDNKDILR